MLLCNNCGQHNPGHVDQCQFCKMAGDFTPIAPATKQGSLEPETPSANTCTCVNCGEAIQETDARCGHCHFPVIKAKPAPAIPQPTALKWLRKTA